MCFCQDHISVQTHKSQRPHQVTSRLISSAPERIWLTQWHQLINQNDKKQNEWCYNYIFFLSFKLILHHKCHACLRSAFVVYVYCIVLALSFLPLQSGRSCTQTVWLCFKLLTSRKRLSSLCLWTSTTTRSTDMCRSTSGWDVYSRQYA